MYKAVILATAAHALQAPQLKRAPRAAAVSAVAPAPVWVAGSILGGAAGTPFVVKATNSWYSDPTVLKLPSWTPCLLYTSPSPRDGLLSRMPSSA